MKLLLTSLIFSVLVSIFAYVCMANKAASADWVTFVNPVGVILGFVITFHGVMQSKKYEGLLGLTQLSFWPLYGFLLRVLPPPSSPLQVLLTTLITLYLGASLTFFGLSYYRLRSGEKPHDAAAH